jgi:hypothetical protein
MLQIFEKFQYTRSSVINLFNPSKENEGFFTITTALLCVPPQCDGFKGLLVLFILVFCIYDPSEGSFHFTETLFLFLYGAFDFVRY